MLTLLKLIFALGFLAVIVGYMVILGTLIHYVFGSVIITFVILFISFFYVLELGLRIVRKTSW